MGGTRRKAEEDGDDDHGGGDDDDDDEGTCISTGVTGKPPIWSLVEQCMAAGTLGTLREGRYGVRPDGSIKTREEYAPKIRSNDKVGASSSGASKKAVVRDADRASEEESDGGFFEA